jgi:hypothetical protein
LATLEEVKNAVKVYLKEELKIMEMILKLNEKDAMDFKDWYINQPLYKGAVEIYGLVESGNRRMGYTKLKIIALSSWDKQTRLKTVDTLASYRKKALSALIDIACASLDNELREYALDKIKQINEA